MGRIRFQTEEGNRGGSGSDTAAKSSSCSSENECPRYSRSFSAIVSPKSRGSKLLMDAALKLIREPERNPET